MITEFGSHTDTVYRAVLEDGDVSVNILNYGCITQDWRVPLDGYRVPVVLGFDEFHLYPKHSRSFGIIAGRVANRTAKGRFALGGRTYKLPTNNGAHHLHGGMLGLGRRLWTMEANGPKAVRLTYHSHDGEEGYPGAIDFTVDVSLDGHTVTYDMTGMPDRPTPVNLAQHSYYNVGDDTVLDHTLHMLASRYTPVDDGLIPTGRIEPVAGTHFDFTKPVRIGEIDPGRKGIDLNLVLDEGRDADVPAAVLSHDGGLTLKLWTDQPGIQVFDAPALDIPVPGLDGQTYGAFAGICLEAQHFPDALNQPDFAPIIATPDQPYRQTLRVEIK